MAEKKSYGWAYPLIIIGGLAIGAYLIWNYLQKSPIAQAVNTVTNTIEKITEKINTPYVSYNVLNPGTGQPLTINAPTPLNIIYPPTGIPGFIDYATKAGEIQAGTIAKTAANVIGAVNSPSASEAAKNVLLDFITGGFLKSGSGLITPPIEQKTVISSPQGTYVATSPIVGINWQTTSVLSQPVKDVLTALQQKTLTQQGFTTAVVGTRIVATNATTAPIINVNPQTGVATTGTTIVPKTTVSAPNTAPIPILPIMPTIPKPTTYITPPPSPIPTVNTIRSTTTSTGLVTPGLNIPVSVVSQPTYIKSTSVTGTGAYAKPGGM